MLSVTNIVIKLLMTWFVKNWKTTATGVVGFAVTKYLGPWLVTHGYNPTEILAYVIAGIGILAKDGDKSNAPVPAEFSSNVQAEAPVDYASGG
jgi:predicted membrane-bound mannosyltransferase